MPLLTDHVLDEDAVIRVLTRRLIRDYSGRFRADEVEKVVAEVRGEFAGAKVRMYVPILVDRKTRERLEGVDSGVVPVSEEPVRAGTLVPREHEADGALVG
jgi:hypothetical protein